jgi:hypothetical protein
MGVSGKLRRHVVGGLGAANKRPSIASANLAEFAMNLNMELGVLVRGGELPGQVRLHFERLIGAGALRGVG